MAKVESRVLEFMSIAQKAVGPEWPHRCKVLREALHFALQQRFVWDVGDYAELFRLYGGMRATQAVVFSADHDHHHVVAVEHGNESAARSIDAHYKQKRVLALDPDTTKLRRVTIGSAVWLPDDASTWYVTQLPHQADKRAIPLKSAIACVQYDKPRHSRDKKIVARRTFLQSRLMPGCNCRSCLEEREQETSNAKI